MSHRSEDAPNETPAGDYLKPEVIKQANDILWKRKNAARLKYGRNPQKTVWTGYKPKETV